jgi:large subunit ribosomal protein L9
MNVQIILNEDVANLGRTGDVVKVRPGYARNFLFPRKLAIEASTKSLRAFEHNKRLAMGKREAQKTEATDLKRKLDGLTISIGAHAGEEGKLFGSVTTIDIERALREKGFSVERRKIHLAEPIKQLGEFTVPVRLQPEVEASLKVEVKAE